MTTHQAVQELIQTAFLFNGGEGAAGGYVLREKKIDVDSRFIVLRSRRTRSRAGASGNENRLAGGVR